MMKRSASRSRASSSDARSLSMTHSTPASARCFPGSYIVGMPPPPAAITMVLCSRSHLIWRNSKMRLGSGDGTTRRHLSPSGLNTHSLSAAIRSASSLEYTGPMNLVGSWNAGSPGSTSIIVSFLDARELKQLTFPDDFTKDDKDGDGRVSLREFLRVRFHDYDLADKNDDGVLSLEEVVAAYEGRKPR